MNKEKIKIYTIILAIITLTIILIIGGVLAFNNSKKTSSNETNKDGAVASSPSASLNLTKEESIERVQKKLPKENVTYKEEDNKFYYINVNKDKVYTVSKTDGQIFLYSQELRQTGAKKN